MVIARRRGAYKVGVVRRASIVESASRHFAASGYQNVSMAQIAKDVNITDSGLLHYFPSKHHLLLAVVHHRIEAAEAWWERIPEDAGVIAMLRGMVEATRWHLSQPGLIELFVLMASEMSDPTSAAHEVYARQYDGVIEAVAKRFRYGVQSGEVREDLDCEALARECIAVSDGLQMQWVLKHGELDLVSAIHSHGDRLARAITCDGRGLDA
ncbi:TetR/AcrR family transcriptional regulator [Streptomyces sp. NPDC048002]|uniref:TetR/AcrR family transcriptional regulator n=1 Tax=Streptomyces sp. NPDC048002 TaxID=3154344 RepID=UPI0033FB0246